MGISLKSSRPDRAWTVCAYLFAKALGGASDEDERKRFRLFSCSTSATSSSSNWPAKNARQPGSHGKIFQRESLDTALLARIGQALNHNFFEDLARSEQAGRENPATEA